MSTPMLQQYYQIKQEYADCVLLFRMGDFYEGFDEDAKILSKTLGITLTGRGKDENRQAMAGIPYHALKQYLPKLIKAGLKVAIAEQLEAAKPGTIVKREVVKVITPGTIIDEENLDLSDNNYIACIHRDKEKNQWIFGLSFADLSTGEFKVAQVHATEQRLPKALLSELLRLRPAELLIPRKLAEEFRTYLPNFNIEISEDNYFDFNQSSHTLQEAFGVNSLKGFGIKKLLSGTTAAGALYSYLQRTQKTELRHITKLGVHNLQNYMILDQTTIRNLELIFPLHDGSEKQTLFATLNCCATPMGQRLLRNWLLHPLIFKDEILARQEIVQELVDNSQVLTEIIGHLNGIVDLERVLARIATKNANARDLLFLRDSLHKTLAVIKLIETAKLEFVSHQLPTSEVKNTIQEQVILLIDQSIKDDPVLTITEGDIIKKGYNAELDQIQEDRLQGKEFIKNLQQQEIKRTGISSLKVKFNKVFGYYIEISKSNLHKAPDNYLRKQTLVNAERFITEELKYWEERILGAEEKAAALEYQIFENIRNQVLQQIISIQELIRSITAIDLFTNLANLAIQRNYCRPELSDDLSNPTLITAGRHPVVEMINHAQFIPNDTRFQKDDAEVLILTGPNMSGKSTFIRQNALIFLMAQIGSFVPASKAQITIADRIFTRVGASDNLASGESTFMVEMNETANILNNATASSLVILDEVGRGTSTYDGVAIAWAVAEFLAQDIKARTLFATHYHELIQLESKHPNIKNLNVEVRELNGEIFFMHKIIAGGTDKSYGIHVAQIAGVPKSVIQKASDILNTLEDENQKQRLSTRAVSQLAFELKVEESKVHQELKSLDLNIITPLDALNKLKELQDKAKQ